MVIETCPKCGTDLLNMVIATNPPIPQKQCPNCGWEWTGTINYEELVRVPFNPDPFNKSSIRTLNADELIKKINRRIELAKEHQQGIDKDNPWYHHYDGHMEMGKRILEIIEETLAKE